jgi:hypothetical protein
MINIQGFELKTNVSTGAGENRAQSNNPALADFSLPKTTKVFENSEVQEW